MNYGLSPAEQAGRRAQQRGILTQRIPETPPMFTPFGGLPLPTITSDTADQLASQRRWQEANQMARQNPDRYRVINTPTDLGFSGAGTTAGFINRQSGIFPQVTQYLNPRGGGLLSSNAAMTGLRPPPQPTPVTSGPMPWGMQRGPAGGNIFDMINRPTTGEVWGSILDERGYEGRVRQPRGTQVRTYPPMPIQRGF
jgi:hypothetical protein